MEETNKSFDEVIQDRDGEAYKKLMEAYKGGYLDGMIAGLHAARICDSEIADFLGCDINYVKSEIATYKENCEKSNGKIKEYYIPEVQDEKA